MTELSIIIPAYNVEHYIGACLDSLFHQGLDETRFEVIIVNDGSTDATLGVIKSYSQVHTNIVVVDKPNAGQSQCRNLALRMAKGDYVLFVDSDDVLLDGKVRHILNIAKNNDADMCRGGFVMMSDERISEGLSAFPKSIVEPKVKSGIQALIDDYNPDESYVWRFLFRRAFLEQHDIRFPEGKIFEDIAFLLDAYTKASTFVDTQSLFYIYRQRQGTSISSMSVKKLIDLNDMIQYTLSFTSQLAQSPAALHKVRFSAFHFSSKLVWYLAHYRNLNHHSHRVISDLKLKVGRLDFSDDWKQKLFSFCINNMPYLYIRIRYLLAKRKY